jgi:hypothetical protein
MFRFIYCCYLDHSAYPVDRAKSSLSDLGARSKVVGAGQNHRQINQWKVDIFLSRLPLLITQPLILSDPEREHVTCTARGRRGHLTSPTFPPRPPYTVASNRYQKQDAANGREDGDQHALAWTPADSWKQNEQRQNVRHVADLTTTHFSTAGQFARLTLKAL